MFGVLRSLISTKMGPFNEPRLQQITPSMGNCKKNTYSGLKLNLPGTCALLMMIRTWVSRLIPGCFPYYGTG